MATAQSGVFLRLYKTEKRLLTIPEVSFEQYSSLADDKSAFGKIAIDSLWVQSNTQNKAVYEKLLLSHRYFSVGFQLYDDVKDFARDVCRGQFNWAVYQLQQKVDFAEAQHEPNTLHKYLFVKGVGQDLLKEAIVQFEKAKAVVTELNIPSGWLQNYLSQMITTIQSYLETTERLFGCAKNPLLLLKKRTKHCSLFFQFFSAVKRREHTQKALNFIEQDFRQQLR